MCVSRSTAFGHVESAREDGREHNADDRDVYASSVINALMGPISGTPGKMVLTSLSTS
jgi:hypothetical protein